MPKTRHRGALSARSSPPTGLMKLAAFMAKTGEIKTAPASWQDVFFPLIASLKGS